MELIKLALMVVLEEEELLNTIQISMVLAEEAIRGVVEVNGLQTQVLVEEAPLIADLNKQM